jgi:spermidine synthase
MLVMSDTPDELRDLEQIRLIAKRGQILILGLGLGCVVQLVLQNPYVERVTVVEKYSEVIDLVAPTLLAAHGERLLVCHDDAHAFTPPSGTRYEAIWHDIWDNLCADNLAEVARLKRRFGRYANWQGCWGEHYLHRLRR